MVCWKRLLFQWFWEPIKDIFLQLMIKILYEIPQMTHLLEEKEPSNNYFRVRKFALLTRLIVSSIINLREIWKWFRISLWNSERKQKRCSDFISHFASQLLWKRTAFSFFWWMTIRDFTTLEFWEHAGSRNNTAYELTSITFWLKIDCISTL